MVRICENCGNEHDGTFGSGRFCCKECARSFSTKNDEHKLKHAKCMLCGKEILVGKRANINKCICDDCRKIKETKSNCIYFDIKCSDCYFNRNNICNGKNSIGQKFATLKKYCNFNISSYEVALQNYISLKNDLQSLVDLGYSCVDICKKIFGGAKRGNTVFNILQIKVKTLSDAVANAFLHGKMDNIELWHKTWKGDDVYLRSSYEEDYANELDTNFIDYEYETLKIKYYDSSKHKFRCAIPDFYLPKTNTIVEIKSTWTLDVQEMKDKANEYKKLGYNFVLILNHKETDLYSL